MQEKYVYQHKDLPQPTHPRVWAEISVENLLHNYKALCEGASKAHPVCVVKADAYGHGISMVVPPLVAEGCRHFAVATFEEAVSLRTLTDTLPHGGDIMILVLGYVHPENVVMAADKNITLTCLSLDHAKALSAEAVKTGVEVGVHVALDTGMNRIGIVAQSHEACVEATNTVLEIMGMDGIRVTGMFTHFYNADDEYSRVVDPEASTLMQYGYYMEVYHALCKAGKRPAFCHVCNSAATARGFDFMPDAVALDGVRMGISLYGYGVNTPKDLQLRPVMRLKTRVVHLHTCPTDGRVGYGGEYTATSPRCIATLSVGYADGFERGFKGGEVIFHTQAADLCGPLVGRICMDQCMADVTDLDVSVGDAVTLFGDTAASLEALCQRAGTIPYEPLCLISGRVPRIRV